MVDKSVMDDYFAGRRLYGDGFTLEQIAQWYEDEREGYATFVGTGERCYTYDYHSLNRLHGFPFIKGRRFISALGLGSAYGHEFLPIADQIEHITILDPSDTFRVTAVGGVSCDYMKPTIDGLMPFEDESFDLVTCLGVLHHIANVTTVVKELYRCLSKGGYLLLREPIVSMGDWTRPRRSATKRERGIPLPILCRIVEEAGFRIVSRRLCVFAPVARLWQRLGLSPYNSGVTTRMDAALCRWFRHRVRYHATRLSHKIRPAAVYLVVTK